MQEPFTSFGAEHLRKSFRIKSLLPLKKDSRKKEVLKDISFKIKPGECMGILGANGCGKSTLLSILAGIGKADGGTVLYNNTPISPQGKDAAAFIGFVPQEPPLIPELTALDNLRLWYADSPLSLENALKGELLSILGISDFLDVPVYKMSGGMKKRLSIGCCTAGNPGLLFLDEPGAALDIPCKERIETYLKKYKECGNAILLTTHEEREIRLCDTLYILKNGILTPYQYDGNIHHVAGAVL